MSFNRKGKLKRLAMPLSLAAALLGPTFAMAQEAAVDHELEQELRYIEALSNNGYANFAPAVIEAAQKRWPQAKARFEAASIRAELRGGNQEAVIKRIEARPDKDSLDTWMMKLELALSYASFQKYKEAEAIYSAFFKKFPTVPAAYKKSYYDAAFYYISMLRRIDRVTDAMAVYPLALANAPEVESMKVMRADYLMALLSQAELTEAGAARDKMIADADAIAQKMIWDQDSYFGDAITGLAYLKMLRGDINGSQELIKDYLDILMDIHSQYKEQDPTGSRGWLSMSPLPKCRYLIGKMLYDQAKAEIAKGGAANEETIKSLLLGERDPKTKKRNGQGAVNHLVNVYIGYPESQSAPQALKYAEEIIDLIQERYDTALKIKATDEQRAKVLHQQFVEANVKFDNQEWEEAAAAFAKTLSRSGLSVDSLDPMRKMVECYVRGGVKDGKLDPVAKLYAETITAALAEGFSGQETAYTQAGNTLSRIATFYGENKLLAMQEAAYDNFFRYYPKHEGAVALQISIAKERKATDPDAAEKLLLKVIENLKEEPSQKDRYAQALSMLTMMYRDEKPNPDLALKTAQAFAGVYANDKRPGFFAAQAQLLLASCYFQHAEYLRKVINGTLPMPGAEAEAEAPAELTPEQIAEKQKAEEAAKKKMKATLQAEYKEAAKLFGALAKELGAAENKYVSSASDRKDAEPLREQALFQQAMCYQRLATVLSGKTQKGVNALAVKAFEACAKAFPKGKYAPKSLLQVGTMQAAEGDLESAKKTLDQLKAQFKDSSEAKNAIPLLADSLFEMGHRAAAASQYKEMFKAGGEYTPTQYLSAGERLLENDPNLAVEACDCVLKAKGAQAYEPRAMLLKARALLAAKKPKQAADQLAKLLEAHGKKTIAKDANLLLLEVIGKQIVDKETTFDDRNTLLGAAKKAKDFVAMHERGNLARLAELNLSVAKLTRQSYEAEKMVQSDRIAAAAGAAMNAYRVATYPPVLENEQGAIVERPERDDPRITKFIQEAYLGYLQVASERARASEGEDKKAFWQDVIDIGGEYMSLFPKGTYRTDVQNALNEANVGIK